MVAFADLILAFLHHTSYDEGVGPFLQMDLYLENVKDIHDQDHQLAEFV